MPGTSGSRSSSADRRSSSHHSCCGSSQGSPVSACDDRTDWVSHSRSRRRQRSSSSFQALAIYTIIEFAVPVAPAFVVLGTAGLVGTREPAGNAVSGRVIHA